MNRKIREIAEIRTGYQFRGKVTEAEDGNVALIQIKDLKDDGGIAPTDLVRVQMDNPAPYLVEQWDVLFLSRGTRLTATLVETPVENTIATGFFFIVRGKPKMIRPGFLAWSLNQPAFQDALKPFVRGTHMPIVSKSDYLDLPISVPPLAVQDRVMELQALFDREKRLTTTLEARRQELVRAVSDQLSTGRLKITGDKR